MKSHEILGAVSPELAEEMIRFLHENQRALLDTVILSLAEQQKVRTVFVLRKPWRERGVWLTKALSRFGHEVAVFVPGYRIVLDHPELARAESRLVIRVEMGDEFLSGEVIVLQLAKRLTLFVIRRDEFFDRRQPYGCDGRDYDENPPGGSR